MKALFSAGAFAALLAVALGAAGSHALQFDSAQHEHWFDLASRYHLFHAIAMLIAAFAASHWQRWRLAYWSGWGFALGIVMFSGGLYGRALGAELPGGVVPLGGSIWLASWLMLLVAPWRQS